MHYSKLAFPGDFSCTECQVSMIRKYTNALTCGPRCRKRRQRRLHAEAAQPVKKIASKIKRRK